MTSSGKYHKLSGGHDNMETSSFIKGEDGDDPARQENHVPDMYTSPTFNSVKPCEVSYERSPLILKENTKLSLRFYLLGPVLFIMIFSFAVNSLVLTQYVYKTVEEDKFPGIYNASDDKISCSENKSSQEYKDQQEVQRVTSTYNIYSAAITGIPAIFVNLLFASLSDKYGRKVFIVITLIGNFVRTAMLAVGMYLKWNIYVLLVFEFLGGATGGWIASLSIGFAALADVTKPGKTRAFAIVLTEIALGLGALAGTSSSGYLIDDIGYHRALMVSSGVGCLGVVLSLVFPETLKEHHTQKQSVIKTLKSIYLFYTKDTSVMGQRWKFWTCLTILLFIFLGNFGKISIETLYQLNSPFCWTSIQVGLYTTLRTGLPLVIGMSLIKPIQRCVEDHVIGVMGALSNIAGLVLEGFAYNDLMMIIVAFISFLGALPVPIIRAIMSHMTPPEKQGSLFAGIAAVETVCGLVGNVTANAIYAATVDWFRGFTFFLFAAYTGVACVLLLILFIAAQLEQKDGKPTGQ